MTHMWGNSPGWESTPLARSSPLPRLLMVTLLSRDLPHAAQGSFGGGGGVGGLLPPFVLGSSVGGGGVGGCGQSSISRSGFLQHT